MNKNHKKTELFFWAITPALICLLLFFLCIIPKHIWGMNSVMPLLPLIPIFYWGRSQASEIPLWFACIIGLLMDAVSGMHLGVSAILYLLFLFVLDTQNAHFRKEGFVLLWFYFAIMLAALSILQIVIMSAFSKQLYALTPAFLQFLLTTCLYPLFHKLFDKIEEYRQNRRWRITHIQ